MSKTILIIGGYGVFGGKLADALSADPAFDVIVAGRSLSSAERFCEGKSCRPLLLDTAAPDLAAALARARPFIVVDASGPFQTRRDAPYRVAEAAL
ncbi:MAG: saccharopine dehydrogenase, partial [Hyphomonas sp.]|nr:saccharopine dehydrogenase [Hyphomonas sp.]